METIKIAEIRYTLIDEHDWSLHVAGCSDIKADAQKGIGNISFQDVSNRQEAIDWVLNEDTRAQGYGEENVKFNPCFDRAFRELNARNREAEVRHGGIGMSISPYLTFDQLVEAVCMALKRSHYTSNDVKDMDKRTIEYVVGSQVSNHGTLNLSNEWKSYLGEHPEIAETIVPMAESLVKYAFFGFPWTSSDGDRVDAFYSLPCNN